MEGSLPFPSQILLWQLRATTLQLPGRIKPSHQLPFPMETQQEEAGWQRGQLPLGNLLQVSLFKAFVSLHRGDSFLLCFATAALCEQHQNLLKLSSASAWLSAGSTGRDKGAPGV